MENSFVWNCFKEKVSLTIQQVNRKTERINAFHDFHIPKTAPPTVYVLVVKVNKSDHFPSSFVIRTGLSCKAKVLNKNCGKSFENTIVPEKTQRNKTFQDKESEAMGRMMNSSTNEKCKTILAKLACASYTPPCNRNKMETLCRTECVYLFDNCQGAADIPGVVAYCAEPAEGYSDNGFCKLNRWPSARHWETGEEIGELCQRACIVEKSNQILMLINIFITLILKSLVVPAIWLARIGAIYLPIAPSFSQPTRRLH